MHKIIESPPINLKKNIFTFTSPKTLCIQMEQDIFNFINRIRKNPPKLIQYLTNHLNINNNDDFEIEQVINFVNNLSIKNLSFPPLKQKKELTKISNDLLKYIINLKQNKGRIKNDLMENRDINLRKRAAPNIRIRGKYYEGIVFESNNIIEIISYILKDIKGRNVLFNEKIKYIGIACGIIENIKNINDCKICTIIDLVQDFDNNYLNNNNSYLIEKRYNDNFIEKKPRNTNFIPKSLSYDKFIKRKNKRKKFNNNNIIGNTYDNILIEINQKNSPALNDKPKLTYDYFLNEKSKTPNISSSNSKVKSHKIFTILKTPNNTNYNKINKNNSVYYSKYEKKYEQQKTEEEKDKKEFDKLDNISEDISSVSFTKQRSKKKLKPEEKIQLLKQINQESRDKSKKKKSAIKIDEDSKSASYTNQKNNGSNDASFSEITSLDNDKRYKEPKININELKIELKKELKNEVKEELKAELENKMNINNELKMPLLKLFLSQTGDSNKKNKNINNNSNDINKNNNTRETKGIDNYNTNKSINSIDIFLPPNKNITAINDNDKDMMPGLININSNILNNNNLNNSNNIKKENVITKFVKLNRIRSNKGNKTPENTSNSAYNNFNSPYNKKKNYIYHKIPFANNNIYCNNIRKRNDVFNLKIKTFPVKKPIITFGNLNNQNILITSSKSPRPTFQHSKITFKKMIVKNINNNTSQIRKTAINKIIKIPKKIINNLNYIDNNSIIINNKTNNIVYIKQTSPIRMKCYENDNGNIKK